MKPCLSPARPLPPRLLGLIPWMLVLAACAQLESDTAAVTTEGPHSVLVGASIQLTATTRDAKDPGYTFESENPALATVDATGLVTGVAVGETAVKVTGTKSRLTARHVVVVTAPVASPDGGVPPDQVPFFTRWAGSPHADVSAEAFSHWNEEGSVPTACAKCHSTEGFVDYLGGDGTAPGQVETPGRVQSGVRCEACHNSAASSLTSVTFPSGKEVSGLGAEARCMVCHQGRAAGRDIDAQVADAGVSGEDTASPALGFTNIHYYPAAATLFASQAAGGYQYTGQVYDTRFRHVPGFDKCNECHDPHSTQVRWEACSTCHPGTTDVTKAWNIRQIASRNQDYDGDGDRAEGIYFELQGLREKLLAAIQRYGAERAQRLCYGNAHPYWFKDTDGDGACSQAESVATNRFASWSPRLQKAAYNYQLSKVDPGAFAHNAKYVIQLLHDSTQSLNTALAVPFDTSLLVRNDPGHFNGASRAARNWDSSETVQASCSRCHSGAQGYRFFVQYGVGQSVPETANGLECFTCHENFEPTYDVFVPARTWLPDSKTVNLPGQDNLCANCHIGRASKATIDAALAAGGALRFQNVHYMPAAGTREGTLAKIGYEYAGKTYAGRLTHTGGVQCTSCHVPGNSNHTFRVADTWNQRCENCHADQSAAEQIRSAAHLLDYDGDGNTTESLKAEVEGMAARLLAAMRAVTGNGICYDGEANPYFFKDTDQNGTCSPAEAVSANAFAPFTPALVKATHNYQLSKKDPGAWAHNFNYVGQLLFDSVEDVSGAAPTNLVRP
ncbi:Ig-like domain-containing protein [Pyxidicoccus xibeiensis]|uniref:Ig-like domain-containing protein n=1 Tax=Pyxidicoccus xibeiensis TaxID=2906759 RepID=UPI0020A789B4|nr:Ig-like domain-containing protein [Pyxidicoccus xibeiensis]MCP3145328.1 Ig-like domain-containing protein [Pyxidicoccus xibeiensis]